MQADVLTLMQATEIRRRAERGRHTSRERRSRSPILRPAAHSTPPHARRLQALATPTRDVSASPVTTESGTGRALTELVWQAVSPGSFQAFKLSEKVMQSPSVSPQCSTLR